MGLYLIIAGTIGQYYVWTVDWWSPQTVTNTKIGIEDILHAFTIGGVGLALYPTVLKKKIVLIKKTHTPLVYAVGISAVSLGSSLVSFYYFGLHSFTATLVGVLILFCFLIWQRRELLAVSLISGFLLLVVSIPVYIVMNQVAPNFVFDAWMHDNLSGLFLFYAPIEDLMFYGAVGTVILPLYIYGFGLKFQDYK